MTYDRFCVNCVHVSDNHLFCRAPGNGQDPVSGRGKVVFAIVGRSDNTRCGPEGRFYEPTPAEDRNKSWWRCLVDDTRSFFGL